AAGRGACPAGSAGGIGNGVVDDDATGAGDDTSVTPRVLCHHRTPSATIPAASTLIVPTAQPGRPRTGTASGTRAMFGRESCWRSFSDFLSASSMNDMIQ